MRPPARWYGCDRGGRRACRARGSPPSASASRGSPRTSAPGCRSRARRLRGGRAISMPSLNCGMALLSVHADATSDPEQSRRRTPARNSVPRAAGRPPRSRFVPRSSGCGDVSPTRPGKTRTRVGRASTHRPDDPVRKGASALLAITEIAATAIKSLTASQEQPDEAGVRIAARETADLDTPDSLKLSVVDGPAEDDQVSTSTAPTSSSSSTRRHTSTTSSSTPTSTATRSASSSAPSANRHRRPPRITGTRHLGRDWSAETRAARSGRRARRSQRHPATYR